MHEMIISSSSFAPFLPLHRFSEVSSLQLWEGGLLLPLLSLTLRMWESLPGSLTPYHSLKFVS